MEEGRCGGVEEGWFGGVEEGRRGGVEVCGKVRIMGFHLSDSARNLAYGT